MAADAGLDVHRGGTGTTGPSLLLLHGLGQTADLWSGAADLLDDRWPGQWIAVDLPGHGRSARLTDYSYESMTRAVAAVLDPGEPFVVLGHSLGGVIAMMLGSLRYGVDVRAVCGLGVKPDPWPPGSDDIARAIAATEPASFPSQTAAVDHLLNLVSARAATEAAGPVARRWWDSATVERDGHWMLRMDQRVFAVGTHDMRGVISDCRVPIVLATGALDPLCSPEHLLECDPHAVLLDGDHYPHLRNPESLWHLVALLSVRAAGGSTLS